MTFHEPILKKLLEYREAHPSFKFITRQRTGAGNRFESGHWFQGNDKYAFVGLIDASGGLNKTRSVGLNFKPLPNGYGVKMEVVFKGVNDISLIRCYKELIKIIDGFKEISPEKYSKDIGKVSTDNFEDVYNFLNGNYAKLIEVFRNAKKEEVLVSDEKFEGMLSNINKYRQNITKQYWLYALGEKAREWEDFYDKGIMALGWDELGDLRNYNSKEEIVKALQNLFKTDSSKKNDGTANYDFMSKIKIGDVVFVKKGSSKLLGYGVVTSEYFFDASREEYKHVRKINWKKKGQWNAEHKLVVKTLTNISDYPSSDSKYNTYHERLMAIINDNQTIDNEIQDMDFPLNTILYGPPGTGKTYKLREAYFNRFTLRESSLTKEQFILNQIADLTWWQTFAIALYDSGKISVNQLLEHEVVKAKASLSNAKNIRPIAWSRMQAHTVPECPNVNVADVSEPSLFYKETDSEWRVVNSNMESLYPEGIELLDQINNFKSNEDKVIKNFEFVTFHQSFGYEDFVEGIKPKVEEGSTTVDYEIKDGVFKRLCQRAKQDPQNNYAIFIDEINRGNVSAIFGELITLIEDDKRIGNPQELKVKLPYSKTEFGVPSNLYIIGTMNTADRSVEALDTALRRRFVFEEVMPKPNLLSEITYKGFNLEQVLTTINDRIEVLLDRDHTIGHSYFIKLESGDTEGLLNVFKNNIIPLLQEYFYNDYEKIALVLGSGFVEENGSKKVIFPKFSNIDDPEQAVTYELRNTIDDVEEAVGLLLGISNE